jgi:hypothetical protein
MQQQVYAISHDLRSWTAALMFRVTQGQDQPTDFTVGLTFSLKAFPRFGLGSDSDHAAGSLFNGDALLDPPARF